MWLRWLPLIDCAINASQEISGGQKDGSAMDFQCRTTFEDCYWVMTNDRSKTACKIHPKTQRQSASSFGKESGRRKARRPPMGSGKSQGNSRPGGSKLWRQSGFFLEVERILRGLTAYSRLRKPAVTKSII